MTTDATPGSLATRAAAAFAAYRTGHEERMDDLVELLTPILWHTARAQRADAATAEDVVQTAWVRLVEHSDSISEPQAVLQWLITTVRREAWQVVRRADRVRPDEDVLDQAAPDGDPGPERSALLTEQQRLLWQHVEQLSARCREILRVIAFAERPDYAAVASALGMPVGSIGPTRGRCLHKLRTSLPSDLRWTV